LPSQIWSLAVEPLGHTVTQWPWTDVWKPNFLLNHLADLFESETTTAAEKRFDIMPLGVVPRPLRLFPEGLKYPRRLFLRKMARSYEELLSRARAGLDKDAKQSAGLRLELPEPDVIWVGNKTIFRNYSEFPKLLRREPNRVLMYLAKELATAASLDGERAIFIGRKDKDSFSQLLQRYMKDGVLCPVCGSPDTHLEKEKRMWFMICEACGARSVARVA